MNSEKMNSPAPAVYMDSVSFGYDHTPVVEDVSIKIGEKEFVCIVGPNGGGKSTLLKLMLGLVKPDSGIVRIFGRPPEHSRADIGYVPQQAQVDPKFPVHVMDVLLMGRLGKTRVVGGYTRSDREAGEKALEEAGITELRTRAFSALSGGQRQRVLIARALVSEPRLLLLDEPTLNLDVKGEKEFHGMLGRLNSRMTIVMVSHDPWFVAPSVKSVVCVRGSCKIHATSEITDTVMKGIYGGDLRLIRHDHQCSEHTPDE